MSKFAWVTLATNDSYSLGALVVAHSLRKVKTVHQLAVLITPGVSESMRTKLSTVFDVVQEVNVLDSKDAANLALLSRPELGVTFTKLHCWRLTQFEKCVFLDADTLILQNSDELFDREELSAAPDVGWPDCFNSGVFVYRPSLDTFAKLTEFAVKKGSFDGGDQGLLNSFFSDWSQKDISKHLPFIYNTCSTACYSYLPAFKQFGENVKILHFIGQLKPWLLNFDSSSRTAYTPQGYGHLTDYFQLWWTIFCTEIHPKLSPDMNRNDGHWTVNIEQGGDTRWYENPQFQYVPPDITHQSYPNEQITFVDPWEDYYNSEETHSQFEIDSNSNFNHELITIYSQDRNEQPDNRQKDNKQITLDQSYHENSENFKHEDRLTETQNFKEQFVEQIYENNSFNCSINTEQVVQHNCSINETDSQSHNNHHVRNTQSPPFVPSVEHNNYAHIGQDETISSYSLEESGLAGALAQLTLGEPRSQQQEAYEESMRRQCWEAGNIDYLGKDSFDNIWKRISQTLESKNEPTVLATKSERSATPQPDDKLTVEEKKEVKLGSTFDEHDEDSFKQTTIKGKQTSTSTKSTTSTEYREHTVNEVTKEGKIIQKIIRTYPAEETEEVELYETTEVDGQVVSNRRLPSDGEKKKTIKNVPAKAPTSAVSRPSDQPVVIVPGHQKVEFDEKTNTKTVTEKTTTGYQQTITTITAEGKTRIQTKTFFDAVEIPGEEEEEIIEEEIETYEPGTKTTTTTTTTGPKHLVQSVIQENTNELQKAAIVEHAERNRKQSIITETIVSEEELRKSQVTQSQNVKKTEKTNKTVNTEKTEKNVVSTLAEPKSALVKRTTDEDGKETEVETIISEDGLTKTLRQTVKQPEEEIEIEEYEETRTYEPSGGKTKTTQLSTITDESAVHQIDKKNQKLTTNSSEQTTVVQTTDKQDNLQSTTVTATKEDTSKATSVVSKNITATKDDAKITSNITSLATKENTTKATITSKTDASNKKGQKENIVQEKTSKTTKQDTKNTTAVRKLSADTQNVLQTTSTTKTENQKKVAVIAKDHDVKKTVKKQDNGDVVTEEVSRIDGGTLYKWTTVKVDGTQTFTSKTIYDTVSVEESESTTTTSAGSQSITSKSDDLKTLAIKSNKINQDSSKKTIEDSSKKTIEDSSKTIKENVKATTKDTKNLTTVRKSSIDSENFTKTRTTNVKTDVATHDANKKVTVKKESNGDVTTEEVCRIDGGTEYKWTTVRADGTTKFSSKTIYDTVSVEESESTTTTTQSGLQSISSKADHQASQDIDGKQVVVTKEDNGDVTTEEIRRFPGGTEHIWTTVCADGTSKMSSKTFYDTVPVDADDDEQAVKLTELGKKKLPAAPASKKTATTKPTTTKATAVELPVPPPRKKEVKKPTK